MKGGRAVVPFADADELNQRAHRWLICHGEMEDGEQFLGIGPDARQLEPGRGSERAKAINGVFVRKFGDYFFAGSEIKFAIAEVNGLRLIADQVHLDAVRLLIVNGPMPPLRELEVRTQLAIRPHQHIEIEESGHPRAVVVGGFQDFTRFLEIDADD